MKSKLSCILSCCSVAALTFGLAGAQATTIGFNDDPAGAAWDRGNAGTGYAIFDQFATWQFTNTAAASGLGITLPVWSQTQTFISGAQGGGLYNKLVGAPAAGNLGGTDPGTNGDVLFGGSNPVSFVLGGSVSFNIRGIVLQIKRPGSTSSLADAAGFLPTLSINGGTAIPFDAASLATASGDTSSDGGNSAITSYYWNSSIAGLSQGATNTYAITASKGTAGTMAGGSSRGVDGIELDLGNTSVVPEPATVGLLVCGLSFAGLVRRRRVHV